jgi:hypothetical protein
MIPFLEHLVRKRAGSACEYCQIPAQYDELPFEIDHIVALKHGGPTSPGNLALACFACNNAKGPCIAGLDPRSRRLTRLFNPRRHKWHRHFRWEGPLLVGLTAIGRTTIAVLEINKPHRVAFRRALIDERLFPPAEQ